MLKHKPELLSGLQAVGGPTFYLHLNISGFNIPILMSLPLAGKWPGVWMDFTVGREIRFERLKYELGWKQTGNSDG